jgi:hypothetical protein
VAFAFGAAVAVGVAVDVNVVAVGVGFSVGALRVIFYPVQWILSLLSLSGKVKHPLFWDEFIIFPLSGIRHSLEQTLQRDEQQGHRQLAEIMSNPFATLADAKNPVQPFTSTRTTIAFYLP